MTILIPIMIKKAYLYTTSVKNVERAFVVEKNVAININTDIDIEDNLVDFEWVTFLKILEHTFIVILK